MIITVMRDAMLILSTYTQLLLIQDKSTDFRRAYVRNWIHIFRYTHNYIRRIYSMFLLVWENNSYFDMVRVNESSKQPKKFRRERHTKYTISQAIRIRISRINQIRRADTVD